MTPLQRSVVLGGAVIAGGVFERAGDDADERPVVGLTAVSLVEREGDAKSAGEPLEILHIGPTKARCV